MILWVLSLTGLSVLRLTMSSKMIQETRHKRPIFLKVQQQKGGFMKVANGILSG